MPGILIHKDSHITQKYDCVILIKTKMYHNKLRAGSIFSWCGPFPSSKNTIISICICDTETTSVKYMWVKLNAQDFTTERLA